MLVTMMIPAQVILIPQFIIYNRLNLVGTYVPLILPHFWTSIFHLPDHAIHGQHPQRVR